MFCIFIVKSMLCAHAEMVVAQRELKTVQA